jgi:hypothetical protein
MGRPGLELESNKHNQTKEMSVISKYHESKIIHGQYVSILKLLFLHCLHFLIKI